MREGKDAVGPVPLGGLTCKLFWESLTVISYGKTRSVRNCPWKATKATSPSYILSAIWGHLLVLETCSMIPEGKEVVALAGRGRRVAQYNPVAAGIGHSWAATFPQAELCEMCLWQRQVPPQKPAPLLRGKLFGAGLLLDVHSGPTMQTE